MAQTEESINVFYLQQIFSGLQQRVFKTLWGSVLIQTRLVHSYHTTDVQRYLCIHSKAASFLLPNWETIWNVGLDPGVGSYEVVCNDYIDCQLSRLFMPVLCNS